MEVVSFAATKGGVGKTTLTYNFGEWLASSGYKVLMIDNDPQSSLSQTYDIYERERTVADIYRRNDIEPKIFPVREHLDLLPSTLDLEAVNEELQTKSQKELILVMWFSDWFEKLNEYDYILIDNHPDFSTITKNAVLVSDYVFSPIEPGEYSFISKSSIESRLNQFRKDLIDPHTRESYVKAKLSFLANRIKHNTKSSRELLETIKEDSAVIAVVKEKELFNKSTNEHMPIVEMMEDKQLYTKHRQFFDELSETFERLRIKIGRGA